MQRTIGLLLFCLVCVAGFAQTPKYSVTLIVKHDGQPLASSTVQLLKAKDSALVKVGLADSSGVIVFENILQDEYFCRASRVGYINYATAIFALKDDVRLEAIDMQPDKGTLSGVTVTAQKNFIELKPGKTVVNLEAAIGNTGTTAMEALERLPGVTIDRDGNIALKGRSGVLVMIDGKPTYLGAAELAAMLNGMSSAQISQVELMDNPPARYDAAGNAGIINIITKKNKQRGFNGSVMTAYTQGVYPKTNNSIQLAYRSGKWNLFGNYTINAARNFTRLYALRTYYKSDEKTIESLLEQPGMLKGKGETQTFRTGADYTLNDRTSLGLTINGLFLKRESTGNNTIQWMNAQRAVDSTIQTSSRSETNWQNLGTNFNIRHTFSSNKELAIDADIIDYKINGDQFFQNVSISPITYTEASRADLPSNIRIYSAKGDYSQKIYSWSVVSGIKSSHIETDNLVSYEFSNGGAWQPDLGRTNHFLYKENIHALYTSAERQLNKWSVQGGLRYEMTSYDANQLGNAVVKDSSFSRSYNSLFPNLLTSFAADSANTFSFSAGRRIDRPPFQKLNPFLFIINKYTYQQGNPFYRPQYTWNFELSHSYKDWLVTSISYSNTRDYFSQIFPIDTNGIVIYTEGNLGRLQNFGASVSIQKSIFKWWSMNGQAVVNYKKLEGFVAKNYNTTIAQFNLSMNNQFKLSKGWAGELSGFYTSRSQQDIQEVVDPSGQLSVGVSKSVFQNKGTIKLAVRDLFYTQWMKGLTQFTAATEYFKLSRDTRVVALSFTYRFGKSFKTINRTKGAAGEEIERVGQG